MLQKYVKISKCDFTSSGFNFTVTVTYRQLFLGNKGALGLIFNEQGNIDPPGRASVFV